MFNPLAVLLLSALNQFPTNQIHNTMVLWEPEEPVRLFRITEPRGSNNLDDGVIERKREV